VADGSLSGLTTARLEERILNGVGVGIGTGLCDTVEEGLLEDTEALPAPAEVLGVAAGGEASEATGALSTGEEERSRTSLLVAPGEDSRETPALAAALAETAAGALRVKGSGERASTANAGIVTAEGLEAAAEVKDTTGGRAGVCAEAVEVAPAAAKTLALEATGGPAVSGTAAAGGNGDGELGDGAGTAGTGLKGELPIVMTNGGASRVGAGTELGSTVAEDIELLALGEVEALPTAAEALGAGGDGGKGSEAADTLSTEADLINAGEAEAIVVPTAFGTEAAPLYGEVTSFGATFADGTGVVRKVGEPDKTSEAEASSLSEAATAG
jgi:hypothetical protein